MRNVVYKGEYKGKSVDEKARIRFSNGEYIYFSKNNVSKAEFVTLSTVKFVFETIVKEQNFKSAPILGEILKRDNYHYTDEYIDKIRKSIGVNIIDELSYGSLSSKILAGLIFDAKGYGMSQFPDYLRVRTSAGMVEESQQIAVVLTQYLNGLNLIDITFNDGKVSGLVVDDSLHDLIQSRMNINKVVSPSSNEPSENKSSLSFGEIVFGLFGLYIGYLVLTSLFGGLGDIFSGIVSGNSNLIWYGVVTIIVFIWFISRSINQ